ncbi:type II toxin-antitoxin system VapC family toxin [Cryomorpha ignava]|uniref:Type II toxin-antitoxin system VapC family toxin n=1 Tax=Cryomorpha ignava TaxID=101383 RepID=A0A7K3WS66_9FLAO|nr:type II toxin-antitoxin system VapC family toxin [Cryomorpha ignava]NEN24513.1 type II toxin-antitoxin system VapC family toxin [Cryomorpha ignava]
MNLLLDTHTLIWFITDNEKLPQKTKTIIENKENRCFVSIATYWEIGIKNSIGRLDLKSDLKTIFNIIEETGFDAIPVTTNHILRNASLPFHHQDPFDRIIIAQAMSEKMIIVTKDSQIENYDTPTVWEK